MSKCFRVRQILAPFRSRGEKIEGLRGKQALVQAVVKNIARKEVKVKSDTRARACLFSYGKSSACY